MKLFRDARHLFHMLFVMKPFYLSLNSSLYNSSSCIFYINSEQAKLEAMHYLHSNGFLNKV